MKQKLMQQQPLTADDFWDFSLQLYGKPEIQKVCLTLQDQYQLNVNLLLFACYLDAQGIFVSESDFKSLVQSSLKQDEQIQNTRAQRRNAKNKDAELYQNLKQQELQLERLQQSDIVQAMNKIDTPQAPGGVESATSNLDTYRQSEGSNTSTDQQLNTLLNQLKSANQSLFK